MPLNVTLTVIIIIIICSYNVVALCAMRWISHFCNQSVWF